MQTTIQTIKQQREGSSWNQQQFQRKQRFRQFYLLGRNRSQRSRWNTNNGAFGVVRVSAKMSSKEEMINTFTQKIELPDQRVLIVNAKTAKSSGIHTVALECEPSLPAKGLILHWGVIRPNENKKKWHVLPRELFPPGTTVYKEKAMQTPFPRMTKLVIVLDAEATAIHFALKNEETGKWITGPNKKDFVIQLNGEKGSVGSSNGTVAAAVAAPKAAAEQPVVAFSSPTPASPPPSHQSLITNAYVKPSNALDNLIKVVAFTKWEEKGRLEVSESERETMLNEASESIIRELEGGAKLDAIMKRFGIIEEGGSSSSESSSFSSSSPPPKQQQQQQQQQQQEGKGNERLRQICESRSNGASIKWGKYYDASQTGTALVRDMYVETREKNNMLQLHVVVEADFDVNLHWGVTSRTDGTWRQPPPGWTTVPPRSWGSTGNSWETEFENCGNKLKAVTLEVPCGNDEGIVFVLRTVADEWVKNGDGDFYAHRDTDQLAPAPSNEHQKPREREERKNKKEHRDRDRKDRKRKDDSFAANQPAIPPTINAKSVKSVQPIKRKEWNVDDIVLNIGAFGRDGNNVAQNSIDQICNAEEGCTRSLMHRYNAAADLLGTCHDEGEAGLLAMFTWFRFMALRQLVWNNDYNIKPREISAAQARCTEALTKYHRNESNYRDVVRLIMMTIGRGGTGDVGQRIRDEILAVQQTNNCKGGMMEEWHQKLHNNTSPDDVPICEALLKFIASDCDINVYWAHLHANNIDAKRMSEYDRKICSEPKFSRDQYEGLTRDLTEYLRTLKAVHSGADLDSAAEAVLGYHQDACKGKEINIPPVADVATPRLEELLTCARVLREQNGDAFNVLEAILEARRELWQWTKPDGKDNDRLKDVIYLDLALEAAVRQVMEAQIAEMSKRAPLDVLKITGMVLENLCLSTGENQEFVYCLKDWQNVIQSAKSGSNDWGLQAKAVCDRLGNALGEISERYINVLQPTAMSMGPKLNVDEHVLQLFSEEIVRGTPAAPLSQMLRVLDPMIRAVAQMGRWQVISPVQVKGQVAYVDALSMVQNIKYSTPTIIIAKRVSGEEDIPVGCVGVITPDMPDILSHVSVRARNEKVFFATVFDFNVLEEMKQMDGKCVSLHPNAQGDEIDVKSIELADVQPAGGTGASQAKTLGESGISIKQKQWPGKFALDSSEFNDQVVGGKSKNLELLRGRTPNWIQLPASVALPFGTFDATLNDPMNAQVKTKLESQILALKQFDDSKDGDGFRALIDDIKSTISSLKPPNALQSELESCFTKEKLSWPGDLETSEQGQEAWRTICAVWASKYNERAVLSCKKAGLNHDDLNMAVLCQPVVNAKYAFVLHTVHPQTNDQTEIYGELVCGMGEALVGNFAGRALSFTVKKSDLDRPTINGFPSKSKGLFARQNTLIFRSDSNGEDLEGFAGAGLYDSVCMNEPSLESIDYTNEPISNNEDFRNQMLSAIAKSGMEIENLLGSAQDIEGAITEDGKLFVVQTRPQVF